MNPHELQLQFFRKLDELRVELERIKADSSTKVRRSLEDALALARRELSAALQQRATDAAGVVELEQRLLEQLRNALRDNERLQTQLVGVRRGLLLALLLNLVSLACIVFRVVQ